jgi:hypothetical protein
MNTAQKAVVWLIAIGMLILTAPFCVHIWEQYGRWQFALGYIVNYLFVLIPGVALLLTLGTEKKRNWKRGLLRSAIAMSIILFLGFLGLGSWFMYSENNTENMRAGLIYGSSYAGGIWGIYLLLRFVFVPVFCWVVSGFNGSDTD